MLFIEEEFMKKLGENPECHLGYDDNFISSEFVIIFG